MRFTAAGEVDEDTKRRTREWTFASSLPAPVDSSKGFNDVGGDTHRRTQDWTFATSLPLAPDTTEGLDEFADRSGEYAAPPILSRRAEEGKRESMAESLIDLDMSLSPSPPSPQRQDHTPHRVSVAESLIDLNIPLPSPPSPSTPIHSPPSNLRITPPPPPTGDSTFSPRGERGERALPAPPSVEALKGGAGAGVVGREMGRLLGGLVVELGVVRDVLSGSSVL
jgi:hypothetical protein